VGTARQLVIIVDDDFGIRESLLSLLKTAGHKASVFSSAEEFLQSGVLAAAECVITDVWMPGMDGIELQARIRLARPQLPVIFVSAHDTVELRQRALSGGAMDFLPKPFNGEELLALIRKAFTISQD
jgi:FixJ family two-component response regulator